MHQNPSFHRYYLIFYAMKLSILFTILLVSTVSCKKESDPGEMPNATISANGFTFAEDAENGIIKLSVNLSGTYGETITLDYSTADSTATAGVNYEAISSETLTFNPGDRSKTISVNVIHDTVSKEDLYFKIKLSNPVNATLDHSDLTVTLKNVDYSNLAWSDEFADAVLNTSWWNYEEGNNNGWGNNELEVYTNNTDNVHLDSGYLHITALNPSLQSYTSGRLTTKGKKEFTYGKMEIRALMPYGKGIWPALWMLGANISAVSWPQCGEIDIMEYLGHQTATVYGTLHWDENGHKYQGGSINLSTGTFNSSFHIFTLIWTPNRLTWLMDNRRFYELDREDVKYFPWDLPQFFIFNVAVGGNWPGYPDETTVFPQNMIVDYIRVYQ